MILREEYRGKIDPHTLSKFIQQRVYEKATSKSDNGNADWNMIKDIPINKTTEKNVEHEYKKLGRQIALLDRMIRLLEGQLRKYATTMSVSKKVSDLFDVTSGIKITEKEVYEHLGQLPCVASKTTNNGITWYGDEHWLSGFVKNSNKVIVERKCITWAKDGNAGKMFLRNYKFYSNDHCGVMLPKSDDIDLRWFKYTQQPQMYEAVTAKEGQGMHYE